MLQEEVAIAERRRRAVKRGSQLLDHLDELRRSLLVGGNPGASLAALRAELADEPGLIADPELQSALADIELRAAVEIAKLERDAAAS